MAAMAFLQSAASKGGPFGTLMVVLLLLGLFFKTFFVIVHKGQIAVVMLRGKPARRGDVLGPISDRSRWVLRHLRVPGMQPIQRVPGPQKIKRYGSVVFRIPGLGMVKIISTMDKRNSLDDVGFTVRSNASTQPADVVDGSAHSVQDNQQHGIFTTTSSSYDVSWEIAGDVIWHIREDTQEVIDAMFNADELSEIVVSTVSSSIGKVYENGKIERCNYRDNQIVFRAVVEDCSAELLKYGVSIKRIKIRKVQEVPVQIRPLAEAIRQSGSSGLGAEVSAAITTAFSSRLAG